MTSDVVMIRHAQSTWNAEGRFTGWADPPLTDLGRAEAEKAGRALKQNGYSFDRVFTSLLQRAAATAEIILQELNQPKVALEADWRLNERHYGALQGLSKQDLRDQAGDEQVHRWRRGYRDFPPALTDEDPRHPRFDARYADLPRALLPGVENLADTRARAFAFWREKVVPAITAGDRVMISAHGNTLRGLIMALANMTEAEVEQFEIPTGTPIIYRFDEAGEPLSWTYLK
jgi:2,3-bisphosphoglycerate-dependent phosphoglycerate mutase